VDERATSPLDGGLKGIVHLLTNVQAKIIAMVTNTIIKNVNINLVIVNLAFRLVTITANVLALGAVAGFGAQNCQPALNLTSSTKLQVCTSPRLTQNPCYKQFFSFFQSL